MTIVAASQTYPVLRYSDHISLDSSILSSSIVLPLEPFKRNFSRETRHSYLTNLLSLVIVVEGIPRVFPRQPTKTHQSDFGCKQFTHASHTKI